VRGMDFALGIGGDADEESLVAVEGELAAAHAGGRGSGQTSRTALVSRWMATMASPRRT